MWKLWKNYLATLLLFGGLIAGRGQLAITEVMSSAALTFQTTNTLPATSDWWELSNFGTNAIDLTGYMWNDNAGGFIGADQAPFQGLIIQPGESVILVESNTAAGNISTNTEQFRTFWGLNPSVQIRMYTGNGMSSGGDGVRMWAPTAANDADVVDSVDFGAALRGSTFIYNTNTGVFAAPGEYSTNGVNGAFTAAQSDDVGSPGTNTGPVALSISQQPADISVNPGDNAMFSIIVRGIPRPRFQWKFNGSDISGANLSAFTVTNVQISKTGLYSVVVFNGFDTLTSSNAVLGVNAAPEAPVVQSPPVDKTIYIGQSAAFSVVASGVPQPRYQWRFNGGILTDATNSSYIVTGASAGNSGIYSVIVSNSLGVLTNQAALTVTPRPNLVITEVGSSQSTNGDFSGHNDWWELSNFDTFTVDLYGYQFDDNSALRAAAYTITNHIFIGPGESIVFVESMSPNSFRRWWGAVNLKPGLQIIRYEGPNLSFSGTDGDALLLWNPGAADDSDVIAVETFVAATTVATFGYNPDTSTFGDLSVLGAFGAFRAMETDDVGSPGYLRTPPEPRILRFAPAASDYQLTWYGFSNRTYAVEFKNDLADAAWSP
ncbi:MAG TPA: immunoglobulin domain-containing protein, partial [Methylomirabilota bacterium]|nr:immunoglobulin domain-containing protein [Methylomirabilota bacterium]